MIYTLTVECVFGMYLTNRCIRVMEFTEDASLFDLHNAIQDTVNFGRDHPFEFYTANSRYTGKKIWLTLKEKWEEKLDDFIRVKLKDVWPLGRKRLYYCFDFGDRWTFEIRKAKGKKLPDPEVCYPRVIKAIGPNPKQYPIPEE